MKFSLYYSLLLLATNIIFSQKHSTLANNFIESENIIPLHKVDTPPIHHKCIESEDVKKCLNIQLSKFINTTFNRDLIQNLPLNKKLIRIYTAFNIDRYGDIVDIKVRAPHLYLKKETERVLELIPLLIPAKHNNEVTSVSHALPIFIPITKKVKEVTFKEISSSTSVIYPGCERKKNKKKCFSDKINSFVNDNFDQNIADANDLDGLMRIYCLFKVDYKGDISDVKVRAPHSSLKNEAIRVIKTLPKMQPATLNKEPVNLLFTLPILFNIDTKKNRKSKNYDIDF